MHVNSRIRRFILIGILIFSTVLISALPAPTGYVNDFADVLSSSAEREITSVAQALQQNGEIEIAVVTVPSMEGNSIEEYSLDLARSWGIGQSQDNTGLLFLLSMEERQVRIEVGYGLEGDLTDGYVGRILDDYVIPPFKQGDYSSGMVDGTKAIAATLAEKRDFELRNVDSYSVVNQGGGAEEIFGTIVTVIIVFFVLMGRLRLWPLLFLGSARGRSYYRGGFGSSGRGGGFGGGGFGGFSGGSFGGGGASRGF